MNKQYSTVQQVSLYSHCRFLPPVNWWEHTRGSDINLLSHGLGLLNKNRMIRLVLPEAFITHPCLTTAFTDIELYWENSAGDLQLGNLATWQLGNSKLSKAAPFLLSESLHPSRTKEDSLVVKECTIHISSIVSGSIWVSLYVFHSEFTRVHGGSCVFAWLFVCLSVCLYVCVSVCVCVCARADWRSSDLSGEWQKEENGFLRPHNTHRGCLYRPHTKRIYMVTDSSPSMYTKSACLATLPSVLCPRLSTPYDAVALFSWRPCGT